MDMPTSNIRIRDLDEEYKIEPAHLNFGTVFVNTLSLNDSMMFAALREKNLDSISPYQIIETVKKPKIPFGVYHKAAPVGEVTLWNITKNHCYISYWIDESHRNKGIASTAVALTVEYAFNILGLEEVEAPIQEQNEASKDLIQKLYFSLAGYETFTGVDGFPILHELYLQLKPTDQEELSLVDYIEEKYETKE